MSDLEPHFGLKVMILDVVSPDTTQLVKVLGLSNGLNLRTFGIRGRLPDDGMEDLDRLVVEPSNNSYMGSKL